MNIPIDQIVTYARMVVDYQPQKDYPNQEKPNQISGKTHNLHGRSNHVKNDVERSVKHRWGEIYMH